MKISIRTRFTVGMVFFFLVIASISILSAYHMNRLSTKTDAILKDNHLSVIFARDMSDGLTSLNQAVTNSYIHSIYPDTIQVKIAADSFRKSLQLEKNNITEHGEGKLVSGIESGFNEYLGNISVVPPAAISKEKFFQMQTQYTSLFQQTMLLSQMNEQAILQKADEAKKSANKALRQVTLLATICFIVTLTFTYNFAAYFNGRFSKLYDGMRGIGSGNYTERLNFEGEDEFYDISLVFNEMAKNLDGFNRDPKIAPEKNPEMEIYFDQFSALKKILEQMEGIKERAESLIAQLEHKE